MQIEICTDFEALGITDDKWDAVAQQNETNTIFQTYSWCASWVGIFEKSNKLFVLLAKENDYVCGIAPLIIINPSGKNRILTFLGAGNSDYLDFLIPENKEKVLRAFFSVILKHKSEWDAISLENIPNFSTTTGLLHAILKLNNNLCKFDTQTICPALRIKNRIEEANHIANKYSTSRPFKTLQKIGEVEHRIFTERAAAIEYFHTFVTQHIDQWRNSTSESPFRNEDNVSFYRSIIDSLLPKKQLFFSAIFFNGTPISFHFGFDYNSVITWYKPSYSGEYAKYSPGVVLIKSIIDFALTNKKNEFDFTIGKEPFKMRFSNLIRKNNNIFIMKKGYRAYLRKKVAFIRTCLNYGSSR